LEKTEKKKGIKTKHSGIEINPVYVESSYWLQKLWIKAESKCREIIEKKQDSTGGEGEKAVGKKKGGDQGKDRRFFNGPRPFVALKGEGEKS